MAIVLLGYSVYFLCYEHEWLDRVTNFPKYWFDINERRVFHVDKLKERFGENELVRDTLMENSLIEIPPIRSLDIDIAFINKYGKDDLKELLRNMDDTVMFDLEFRKYVDHHEDYERDYYNFSTSYVLAKMIEWVKENEIENWVAAVCMSTDLSLDEYKEERKRYLNILDRDEVEYKKHIAEKRKAKDNEV